MGKITIKEMNFVLGENGKEYILEDVNFNITKAKIQIGRASCRERV